MSSISNSPSAMTLPNLLKSGLPVTAKSLNLLLLHVARSQKPAVALHVLSHFPSSRPLPTPLVFSATFRTLLSSFCSAGDVSGAATAANLILTTRASCPRTCRRAISLAAESLGVEKGLLFLSLIKKGKEMGKGKGKGYDLELQGCVCNETVVLLCRGGFVEEALHEFFLMRRKGMVVGGKSYRAVVKRLVRGGMEKVAEVVLGGYVKEYGLVQRGVVETVLLYLNKGKRVGAAREFVVGNVCEDGVVAYSIVVDGLCKDGHIDKALELCGIMRRNGCLPNIVTYNSVINGLRHQGCLTEAVRLFDSLERHNVTPTVVTYGTLIDAFAREGFLEDANELFQRMVLKNVAPNTHVYNSLIYGHCSLGLVTQSLEFLRQLELSCLEPDAFTVSSLLGGFYVKGDMEGALGFYGKYKSKGVSPDLLGFSCLIKGLGAKGRMEEARSILRDMLQCQSAVCLIDGAGNDADIGSLTNLLVNLCEEGSIKDAINLLCEICYFSFPARYDVISRPIDKFSELQPIAAEIEKFVHDDVCSKSENVNSNHHHTENNADVNIMLHQTEPGCNGKELPEETRNPMTNDFESYYSVIASLCSKGELEKARSTVKAMLATYEECY